MLPPLPPLHMDRVAFTQLYRIERPLLLRQLGRQFRDLDGATLEDVVHDAFDRLWRRYGEPAADGLQGDARHAPEAPGAWLWRTASNAAVDQLRAARRAQATAVPGHDAPGGVRGARDARRAQPGVDRVASPELTTSVPIDDGDDQHALRLRTMREALSGLSPRDRQVLTLLYVDGLRYAQIAERTGLRPASLGTTLLRARQKLAARLRAGLSAEDPLAAARHSAGTRERGVLRGTSG